MRIEITRIMDGKPIASVGSWEAVAAVVRLMDGVPIVKDLFWSGLMIMPQPTRNVLLMDLRGVGDPLPDLAQGH